MARHAPSGANSPPWHYIVVQDREAIQTEFKALLGVPDELSIIDLIVFGPPLKPS